MLDDATPNSDQTATSGTLTLTSTGISWTGSIPVGGTVTVTGTVTVNNPDPGNKRMTSTLTTAAAGSNCPAGGTDPACTATVTVQVPGLTITNAASANAALPGATVDYTVTIADTGQTSYTGILVADDLTQVLTDAAYNGDAAADAGAVSFASPVLTWTGSVSPGGTVTLTFSVTVNNPDNGNRRLVSVAYSSATGSLMPHRDRDRGRLPLRGRGTQPGTDHHQHGEYRHGGSRRDRAVHGHHHQHWSDAVQRRVGGRRPDRGTGRCGLQRRGVGDGRVGVVRQPGPDLDGQPEPG